MKKNLTLTIYLALITFISGVTLFMFNEMTAPVIAAQAISKQKSALKIVLSTANQFNQLQQNLFKGLDSKGNLVGYVFKVGPKGYGGEISMLVGIADGRITGVKILEHVETPGLGALSTDEKPMKGMTHSFLGQFKQKTINDDFQAKKDIVALTGATITSQAVADGVREAISYYNEIVN